MKKIIIRSVILPCLLGLFGLLLPQYADAQYADTWRFKVSPKLLIPFNLHSDVSVQGITETFELGLSDFVSLDQAFSGGFRLEGRRNDWGLFADLSFTYAEDTRLAQNYPLPPPLALIINSRFNPPSPVPAGTPVTAGILASGSALSLEFGVLYRLWEAEATNGNRYFAEPLAAVRFSSLKSELDFELDLAGIPVVRTNLNVSDSPLKSVIGLNLGLETTGRWSAALLTTAGASLISQEDHFSFRISPQAAYAFNPNLALTLGYDFRYLNYERSPNIGLTQKQHALSIGLSAGF